MAPALLLADLFRVEQAERGRVGAKQIEPSALVQSQDLVLLVGHAPVPAEGLAAPTRLTGLQLDAVETPVAQMQVDVILDHDRRGHVTPGLVRPGLVHDPLLAITTDGEQVGLSLVRAGENGVAVDDRREDVHTAKIRHVSGPQHVTRLRVGAVERVTRENDELLLPADRGQYRRGECTAGLDLRCMLQLAPDGLAGSGLQLDQ